MPTTQMPCLLHAYYIKLIQDVSGRRRTRPEPVQDEPGSGRTRLEHVKAVCNKLRNVLLDISGKDTHISDI